MLPGAVVAVPDRRFRFPPFPAAVFLQADADRRRQGRKGRRRATRAGSSAAELTIGPAARRGTSYPSRAAAKSGVDPGKPPENLLQQIEARFVASGENMGDSGGIDSQQLGELAWLQSFIFIKSSNFSLISRIFYKYKYLFFVKQVILSFVKC